MRLLEGLGHRRAIENARAASTELSRRRVEREDVSIFLARLDTAAGDRSTRPDARLERA